MIKYTQSIVNKDMTRGEERDLAIKLLDEGSFWLDNVLCKVCSIERNETHYFIRYQDRIGSNNFKYILVSQLKEVFNNDDMTGKEALESLKETLNNVDNITFYQEEINAIQKELDQLDYIRQYTNVVGDFEKGTKELWWEHIRIIVDDKTKEIWQTWEGKPEDKAITLNECLNIAKKELDYGRGVMIIICESYLKGVIYRYGNYHDCEDFEIAGKMHGFA